MNSKSKCFNLNFYQRNKIRLQLIHTLFLSKTNAPPYATTKFALRMDRLTRFRKISTLRRFNIILGLKTIAVCKKRVLHISKCFRHTWNTTLALQSFEKHWVWSKIELHRKKLASLLVNMGKSLDVASRRRKPVLRTYPGWGLSVLRPKVHYIGAEAESSLLVIFR